ncbi:MAG: DUF2059 domain-containing protein [Candidatus Acidiferrum sp.]|jgi:hypothetical protein
MKAVLALIVIYVGTFLVAIQGSSQSAAQAAQNPAAPQTTAPAKPMDPAKDADIRALMELVGARDLVQEGLTASSEQYREKLLSTVPNNEKGQAFINAFISGYEKKFDTDQVTEQLVSIYDKHYSDEEIKGLLQFYGSPLGQKVAAEMPKINRETQAASRTASSKAAKEALALVKEQNPEVGQNARLGNGLGNAQRRWQPRSAETSQAAPADAPAQP